MNVIIAGGRDFDNYALLVSKMLFFLSKITTPVTIITGAARGADTLGAKFANEYGFESISVPADWDRYGKSAGYRRNVQMAEMADGLVAFWDGRSRGTRHMIDIANERGLKVRVVMY